MKNNTQSAKITLAGFLLFLLPLTITVSCAIVIYDRVMSKFNNLLYVAILLVLYITFITIAFTILDTFRRRLMVDRPVIQILSATNKIASGHFDISVPHCNDYNKQDEYDIIIDNINKMASELKKSEILKNDFISNVSHEIKTPLANIKNYSKALLKDNLDSNTKTKYLNQLIASTDKISNLITNILKLNKLENQSITLKYEKTNISELLRESIIIFEDKLESKSINLHLNVSEITALIDSSYLEIIFNNLISNAIKFTNPNGNINITLSSENDSIIFMVQDDGIGMSDSVGKHIFDKFYQGDTSHSHEGNGLGLALVKKIVDIIGGDILVSSKENHGTTFTVKLKGVQHEVERTLE